jgi:hypothetical protein
MSNALQIEPNSEQRIAVIDLADELQTRKQTLFKVLKRLGIETRQRRESSRRNQQIATITVAEAIEIRNELRRSGTSLADAADVSDASPVFIAEEAGVFYLIRLEPDQDPCRFKVGFTGELEGRLRKHRCSAPFARPIKSWPCRRTWERAAIDCVTQGCEQLHTEVFRAISIADVVNRADRSFVLMPVSNKQP